MGIFNKNTDICLCEKNEISVGKIVFKTIAITAAAIAFVPSVFVKREDGFDAYGLLSRVGYKKSKDAEGKDRHDVFVTLIDLERYGIKTKKDDEEEKNEDSTGIA